MRNLEESLKLAKELLQAARGHAATAVGISVPLAAIIPLREKWQAVLPWLGESIKTKDVKDALGISDIELIFFRKYLNFPEPKITATRGHLYSRDDIDVWLGNGSRQEKGIVSRPKALGNLVRIINDADYWRTSFSRLPSVIRISHIAGILRISPRTIRAKIAQCDFPAPISKKQLSYRRDDFISWWLGCLEKDICPPIVPSYSRKPGLKRKRTKKDRHQVKMDQWRPLP